MNTDLNFVDKNLATRTVEVPGLVWRGFMGESDYPNILKIIHGSREVDGLERAETLADIANNYAHLVNSDPYQDMLFADVGGETVAYSRVWWAMQGDGNWIGFQLGNVLPEWRRKGIGSRLLQFNEERLCQIVRRLIETGQMPADTTYWMDNQAHASEVARMNLVEKHGYSAIRYAFDMLRPDLENVPNLPMPQGVEVRPVKPEHIRQIWEASNEAFRDHWGYIPDPWEDFVRTMNDPDFDPSLWRVAWQGDQVSGMVLSFIDKDQNELYGHRRGYTENICVLRPWRKQGLAKALIALSLEALKARGMTEAGLGVDAENISGALHLYEKMGYRVTKTMFIYRKTINI